MKPVISANIRPDQAALRANTAAFVDRLREMRRYDGIDPLVAQIRQDVADTRTVLGG